MNRNVITISSVAALLIGSSVAFAEIVSPLDGDHEVGNSGFGSDAYPNIGGVAIKTGLGDCLRLGSWSEDGQSNGCEGVEDAPAPEPEPKAEAEPAPEPAPVKKEPIVTTATLGGEALFDSNSADLNGASESALADLLAQLEKFQEISAIDITGHTDSRGSDEYNQGLSMRRAESVKSFLEAAYPNVALSAVGAGEANPVATNSTPEGRQLNRRVEVQVTAKSITN